MKVESVLRRFSVVLVKIPFVVEKSELNNVDKL